MEPNTHDEVTAEPSATAPEQPASVGADTPVSEPQATPAEQSVESLEKGEEQSAKAVDDPSINFYNFVEDDKAAPEESAKESEEIDPEDSVPEEYDFSSVKPDMQSDDPERNSVFISSLAKELKLTSRQAKQLYKIGASRLQQEQLGYRDILAKRWLEEVKADQEIGGANFNTTRANVRRAIEKYGSKEVVDVLNTTKISYYPAVLKMLNKIGADLSEDRSFVNGAPVKAKSNSWRAVYNNSPELKF